MPFWKVIVLGLCTFGVFWILYLLWRLYKAFMYLIYRTGYGDFRDRLEKRCGVYAQFTCRV